jgi:glycosyltransferase involved in cell wall biosynthesis/tetratricopeptide (TPR) repeat protein
MLRFSRASGRPNPIVLADRARDAQQWDAAVRHYRTALARNPCNPPIWVQYGHALKEGGLYVAAEAAYRRAIADGPAAADPYLQLGHVLKLQGRTEQAKAAYLRAFSIDQSLHEAAGELATLGYSVADFPQLSRVIPAPAAADNGPAAWSRRKRRKESIITRADRARDLGQWEIATRFYRKALDRNPRSPPIWVQYGHVLKETGHLAEAEAAYRTAIGYDPNAADARLQLGHDLKLQGKNEEAQAAYLRAFALDPSLPHPLQELSTLGWSEAETRELRRLVDSAIDQPTETAADVVSEDKGTQVAHWLESWHRRWCGLFSPPESFAEAFYLSANPDVAQQIQAGLMASGAEHWVKYGIVEDLLARRNRVFEFCENLYLESNPDVAFAVGSGTIPSGYHHYLMYGCHEGRPGWSIIKQPPEPAYDFPQLQQQLSALSERPLISVIVPVYETDPRMLEWCIESVRRQVYPNWELCIADDGSTNPHMRDIVLGYGRLDRRIKLTFLDENQGIAAASNAALTLATGPWIALLDHDDELTPDALLEVAAAIAAAPAADLIYSDEDKITADGRVRYEPVYKPGWSPELLTSTMYVGHLSSYRKTIIEQVGGFRSEFDGTQDFDLALRVSEVARAVHHIPKILYHWRASATSAAANMTNKSYAVPRQQRALREHLLRRGAGGEVLPAIFTGTWRVRYFPPSPHPMVSIVIPTAGYFRTICGREFNLLRNCVNSLFDSDCYDNFEIVIIDNDDLDDEVNAWLSKLPQVRVLHYLAEEFNLCEKINLGVTASSGKFILLLNDDIEVITPRFLYDMVGLASQPGIGAVGAKLLFPDGRVQHNGVMLLRGGPTHALFGEHASSLGPLNIGQLVHDVFAATGACLLVERDLYWQVGGFDPAFPTNYNDVDFCLKLRGRGLRIVLDPAIRLYHFESASKIGTFSWEVEKFFGRWPMLRDPYFNANFSPDKVFFEHRKPGEAAVANFSAAFMEHFAARQRAPAEESVAFSIIFSLYNTPIRYLRELEASLFNQAYQNFECVIVENGSSNPETLQWFDKVSRSSRVTALRFERNQGIIAAYGAAFRAATGDYVIAVDSDDFLTIDALALLAQAIVVRDRPALLYTDECKSNEDSQLLHPFHKPDWDPLLFTNICFTCHLCCVRRDVAAATGCYEDREATWSHDWDTVWRIHRAGHDPVHVPEITYAWRMYPGSTSSLELSGKPEAPVSQRHVLTEQLRLGGWGRSLDIVENSLFWHDGMWRLKPKPHLRIEACIVADVTGQDEPELGSLLDELDRSAPGMPLVLLVGDSSAELDRAEGIASRGGGGRSIRSTSARDFVGALRRAVVEGTQHIAWIGRDTRPVGNEWLTEAAGLLAGIDDAVLAGGRVVTPEERLLWAGGFFGINGFLDSPEFGLPVGESGYHGMTYCQRSVDGVSSVHWVARSDFLEQVTASLPAHLSPASLAAIMALRAAASGKRVIYTPFSIAVTRAEVVRPTMPDAEQLRTLGVLVPTASRYYSSQLSRNAEFHWVPAYQVQPVQR